ncbi:MAG: nitroreductase family protein [Candidatus Marinimicrobia bacterium]|nr:nitroreductase family protein [Candidatus Neomarinimicrobiota bacterium]
MSESEFKNLEQFKEYPSEEMQERANTFLELMQRRRTVRDFSGRDVPREIIEQCIRTASTAPSGANKQPWHFVAVSDPEIQREIRIQAEQEEREFYNRRAPEEWLKDLEPLGTDPEKPFLEKAPYLIAIFSESYSFDEDSGKKQKNYYVKESVGIATGMLITAIHNAGLASLTHTPSPMGFLNDILDRPSNEKPFLLLVVGYPAESAKVPDIDKKPLEEIATFLE